MATKLTKAASTATVALAKGSGRCCPFTVSTIVLKPTVGRMIRSPTATSTKTTSTASLREFSCLLESSSGHANNKKGINTSNRNENVKRTRLMVDPAVATMTTKTAASKLPELKISHQQCRSSPSTPSHVRFVGIGRKNVTQPHVAAARRFFSSGSGGKRDFYEVLGVSRSADKGSIKKAYFKLAKECHPDIRPGDEKAAEKFKEVTEAYEVLSDDKQRELYNQFGHAGVDPNFQAGGGAGSDPFAGFNFGDGSFHFSSTGGSAQEIDPNELFDLFFGSGGGGSSRRRRPRGPRKGADLQMQVKISFREAVFGASKDLNLRYQALNRQSGEVQIKEREVTVDTPAGIDTGMNLRLQGQGAEGDPGAPAGNLLVQVIVEDDDYFHRDGHDVHTEVPISFTQAILGGTVDVKTLTGEVEMKVPKGCQTDARLLLRGKGIPILNGNGKGNHIVHLKIEIPKEITSRQEELLREFDQESATHGLGISGRLAQVAESAFEKLFGGTNKEDKSKNDSKASESFDDDDDNKKQAAH